jgi:energy-coupling factor transport system permease protein
VELAAAMDSRGYGRTTDVGRVSRRVTAGLVFGGLLGVCVGVYGLLDGTTVTWLGLPMLLAGSGLAALGIWVGGRRTGRTRYRPDPWALPEWLVTGSGLVAAVAMIVNVRVDPTQLFLASVTAAPPVPLLACAGILVAATPAFLAPPVPVPQPLPGRDRTSRMEVAA